MGPILSAIEARRNPAARQRIERLQRWGLGTAGDHHISLTNPDSYAADKTKYDFYVTLSFRGSTPANIVGLLRQPPEEIMEVFPVALRFSLESTVRGILDPGTWQERMPQQGEIERDPLDDSWRLLAMLPNFANHPPDGIIFSRTLFLNEGVTMSFQFVHITTKEKDLFLFCGNGHNTIQTEDESFFGGMNSDVESDPGVAAYIRDWTRNIVRGPK